MRLRDEASAASPLTVILTVVLVAVGLTSLFFFVFVDVTEEDVDLQEVRGADGRGFEVVRVVGDLRWPDLDIRLLDRAGADRADLYLEVPSGSVGNGDRIGFVGAPPAGTYLLLVSEGGRELARVAVTV